MNGPIPSGVASRRRLSPVTVVLLALAALALVVTATSTATASYLIGSKQIKKNAIQTKHLKKNAVTGAKIKNGTINANKLSPAARAQLKGANGAAGQNGADGAPGADGADGAQGAIGPQGNAGTQGNPGPQGLAGVSGYQQVTGPTTTVAPGGYGTTLKAACPAGKKAVGGGHSVFSGSASNLVPASSGPTGDGSEWRVVIVNSQTGSVSMEATAICVTAN